MTDPSKALKTALRDGAKRRKVSRNESESHGNKNLIVFGTERIGYLNKGILQTWNLNQANRHDGVRRMVHMDNVENDLSQWNQDEILNLSENTWMDDCGKAEVTLGVEPNSIQVVDIFTPSSIGYIPRGRLAFAHEKSSQIPIYNYELRETSRLVGFGSDHIEIVQRPTFERIGDENTLLPAIGRA